MAGGLVVHEWIEASGGSERVLAEILAAYPSADLACLWRDVPADAFAGHRVRETWLARTPLRRSKLAALPLMPSTWSRVDASAYEWSLASTHLFAHHAGGRGPRRADRSFAYVHTPARYIWSPEMDDRGRSPFVRAAAQAFKGRDRSRAQLLTGLASNSEFVRRRAAEAWDRDSVVIHPPVQAAAIATTPRWADVLDEGDRARLGSLPTDFVLGASRFVPYKRLDLVIETGRAAGLPVVLAGGGPQEAALLAAAENAGIPVHIVDRPSDALLYALYQRAVVYVFPAVEDFGIMPVEAMAAGARVLVADTGGTTESVVDGETGVHVHRWQGRDLSDAVAVAAGLGPEAARARALEFDAPVFHRRLTSWMGVDRG